MLQVRKGGLNTTREVICGRGKFFPILLFALMLFRNEVGEHTAQHHENQRPWERIVNRYITRNRLTLALTAFLVSGSTTWGQTGPTVTKPHLILETTQELKQNDPMYQGKPYQVHRVAMKTGTPYVIYQHGQMPAHFYLFTSRGQFAAQAEHNQNVARANFTPRTQ